MFPQTIELAYRVTLLAIVGTPFLVPDSIAPITHPLYKETFLPNFARPLTVIHHGCTIRIPPQSNLTDMGVQYHISSYIATR